jgi:hypothetical protein
MGRLQVGGVARLVLLETARDTDGELRVAILPPGPRAVPVAFPTMAAALAALRIEEAGQ